MLESIQENVHIASGPLPTERLTASTEFTPDNETELLLKLMDSFTAAKGMELKVPGAYKVDHEWKRLLEAEWRRYNDAIARRDVASLAGLLRNFFRNEGISGFWGGTNMFEGFCSHGAWHARQRDDMMLRQFFVWRNAFPNTSFSELGAPGVGNPWGYNLGGNLLIEPVFEYHSQAEHFTRLLSEIEVPVILEIGGGFGGLAYHLLRRGGSVKYIGLDLPENLLIQSYYLASAFPKARLLTYREGMPKVDRATLSDYDIVLLPNFSMPAVDSSLADLVVNVRSLSEMSLETIHEYLDQIDRIGRLFFFHENIFAARKDGLWGVPSSQFPPLKNFVLIASSESRWPKYQKRFAYPCQENLLIHKHAIGRSAGTLGI